MKSRKDDWGADREVYTPEQVGNILGFCGVQIDSDTHTHWLCYCPFHGNTDSPALAVDKHKGLWTCFNPSCQAAGTLLELIRKRKGLNIFQSMRLIAKYESSSNDDFYNRMREALSPQVDFVEFPSAALDRMARDLKGSIAESYMKSRGFTDETLEYFGVGYSAKKNMVIVPMHDPKGMPIGLIGRTPSHTDKAFKNSTNLPKSRTAWNFHRAKKTGETVIICEASYDAMRIHQAGYPNVIALLGGHLTEHHISQVNRVFSRIIIMTDFDEKKYRPNCRTCRAFDRCQGHRPGRELGRSIVKAFPNKEVRWGAYDDKYVFPHGAKDASDMTDEEIRHCLRNAVTNFEYIQWNVEDTLA